MINLAARDWRPETCDLRPVNRREFPTEHFTPPANVWKATKELINLAARHRRLVTGDLRRVTATALETLLTMDYISQRCVLDSSDHTHTLAMERQTSVREENFFESFCVFVCGCQNFIV
jgi:hypothetical protein